MHRRISLITDKMIFFINITHDSDGELTSNKATIDM